jgi:hypothetical protein
VWTSVGLGLGLLVLTGTGWVVYNSRDLASVDESGLLVESWPPLPPDENAAVPLVQAAQRLEWPTGEDTLRRVRAIRDRATRDPARARGLVRRNQVALEWLRQAMETPEIEISADELIPPGKSPEPSPLVLVLRLLEVHNVRGALLMAEGDRDGAFEDALLGLHLGARIHRSRGASLPHAMLAIGLGDSALLQLRTLLRQGTVGRVTARHLITAIEAARPNHDSWARIWAGEYQQLRAMYAEEIQQPGRPGWVPTSYVFHPDRTLQRLADLFRGLQRNSGVVCEKQEVLHRTRSPSRVDLLEVVLAPNSVGNILYETMLPPFGEQRQRCDFASSASAVQAAIALKAHLDAHGELPASLSELVPELLDAVPRDGFRGEPLRYARAERALYLAADGEPWRLGF